MLALNERVKESINFRRVGNNEGEKNDATRRGLETWTKETEQQRNE